MVDMDKIRGMVYGMALGDAWRNPTEHLRYEDILPRRGEFTRADQQLIITDDTQMSIYTLSAVRELVDDDFDFDKISTSVDKQNKARIAFADKYVKFAQDPRNDRAPGVTVMTSITHYAVVRGWGNAHTGTEGVLDNAATSKGSGTVMRTPWLGALPYSREIIAWLTVLSSQTTHGHPTAHAAAAVAALMVNTILTNTNNGNLTNNGGNFDNLFQTCQQIVAELKTYRVLAAEDYREVEEGLAKFSQTPFTVDDLKDTDPCSVYGDGWTADTALFCALGVANAYQDDPVEGIRRLVVSNGNSDTIAAIGGAFLGAMGGSEKLDQELPNFHDAFEMRYQMELGGTVRWLKDMVDDHKMQSL